MYRCLPHPGGVAVKPVCSSQFDNTVHKHVAILRCVKSKHTSELKILLSVWVLSVVWISARGLFALFVRLVAVLFENEEFYFVLINRH